MQAGHSTEEGLSYEDAEETIAEEERIGLASTVFACAIPAPLSSVAEEVRNGDGATRAAPKGTGDIFRRACEQGNVAQIQEMLTLYGDSPIVHELDDSGKTPVYLCAAYGKVEALQVLLAAGLDATYANDGGFSPLTIAVINQHAACVELLKLHGAKLLPSWLSIVPCAESILGHYFVGCFFCSCPFVVHIIGHLLCRHICYRNSNRSDYVASSAAVSVPGVGVSMPPAAYIHR